MRRTPLRRVGKDYARALREYHSVSKPEWLAEHPECQYEVAPGIECRERWGVTIHHRMRRKRYLNDRKFFITLCRFHHDWVETHKKKARELGYILYD